MPEHHAPAALVLTRPAAQAADWAQRLQALGVPTRLRPLIETQALAEAQAPARAQAAQADWVFFTSSAAVEALFGHDGWAWPQQATALCVGPGTAAALRAAGVQRLLCPPDDAAQFDSETLWPLLRAQLRPGARVLWLRGDGGRDWLIEQLREAGAQVEPLAVYTRRAPSLDAAARAELQAWLSEPLLWLFSSGEAVGHLQALAAVDWPGLRALATHPRIAERLASLGSQAAVVPPQLEAVAAAWRTLGASTAS